MTEHSRPWRAEIEQLDEHVQRFRIAQGDSVLGFGDVMTLLQRPAFADYFNGLLADAPFSAFFWECRPVTSADVDAPFEFVLVRAPSLTAVEAQQDVFAAHFRQDKSGVAVFENLGGDATLVAPGPVSVSSAYVHLAAFCRQAPRRQRLLLWREVGRTAEVRIGASPVWLSTSGLGVYWLHVRIDVRPKYYQFAQYKNPKGWGTW